ncbi:TRAP transporter small permease [Mesorhizobium sp. 1B3]|uniref:TRAP transporter small permease n=1 Tax=Mesorhizobium sp. 1B3 TaxID=3243599 RepID=UPI003D9991CE
MNGLVRNLNRVLEIASVLGAVALIAISLLISVDIMLRWIVGRSIVGVFEISSVLLVMATFLPLGLVLFRNEQLRVDIIFEWVRGPAASLLSLVDVATGLAVFGLLLWIATEEFQKAYDGRFLLRGMIEIPTWIPLGMIWTGTGLALLTLLVQGIRMVLRLMGRPDGSTEAETTGTGD